MSQVWKEKKTGILDKLMIIHFPKDAQIMFYFWGVGKKKNLQSDYNFIQTIHYIAVDKMISQLVSNSCQSTF